MKSPIEAKTIQRKFGRSASSSLRILGTYLTISFGRCLLIVNVGKNLLMIQLIISRMLGGVGWLGFITSTMGGVRGVSGGC